jgi:hypothetical protein
VSKDPSRVVLSYQAVNKTLGLVIKELGDAAGVNIVFSDTKLRSRKTVTVSARNERLVDILAVVLEDFRLTYEIVGKNIVIVNPRNLNITKEFIISGFIRDFETNEILPYASVSLADRSKGVYANEFGFYSLKLRRGTYTVKYNYSAFVEDSLEIYLRRDSTADIRLKSEKALQEVLVEDDADSYYEKFGEDYISNEKIGRSIMLGGEADVLRAVNTSTGVNSASDGFGGLSVRGGNYDQNMILYDGVPLQNTGHAFGIISIFNANVIQDARLIKGGFPARYGGRLSSILDIRTREGNKNDLEGEFTLSTLASSLSIEGPFAKEKSSFLFSYRRTFADPWIKEISKFINNANDSEGETSYFFDDINGKMNFKIGKRNRIAFNFYKGNDNLTSSTFTEKLALNTKFQDTKNSEQSWGNTLASVHWNTQVSKNYFSKILAYQSDWKSKFYKFKRYAQDSAKIINDIYSADLNKSNLLVRGIKWDNDYQYNSKYLLRWGAAYLTNESTPKFINLTNINNKAIYPEILTDEDLDVSVRSKNYMSSEINGYVENEIKFTRSTSLNIGLHSSMYRYDSMDYTSLQPRFSFTTSTDNMWFNLSSAFLRQYHQVLSNTNLGLPSDVWVSASKFIKPADVINNAMHIGFKTNERSSVQIGAFYKLFTNLAALGEGQPIEIDGSQDWQRFVPRGKGTALGAEVSYMQKADKYEVEVNYTVSKSTRNYRDLNNGNPYAYNLDRMHNANANLVIHLGNKTSVNIFGTYQTGNPYTKPTGNIIEQAIGDQRYISVVYDEKNGDRFPEFIRLDAGITIVTKNQIGSHKIYFGLYNIMNRKNPILVDISRNLFNVNSYELSQTSIFPILPALSYSFRWD